RGVDGAQASLILDDGTVVAVQSTQYVGPGQIGWFNAHFRAPSEPGQHTIRLRPAPNGRGPLADLGIHAVMTVTRSRPLTAPTRTPTPPPSPPPRPSGPPGPRSRPRSPT